MRPRQRFMLSQHYSISSRFTFSISELWRRPKPQPEFWKCNRQCGQESHFDKRLLLPKSRNEQHGDKLCCHGVGH